MKMKKSIILGLAVATVLSQGFGVSSGNAQEFYKAFMSVVGVATNQNGTLIYPALFSSNHSRRN